MEAIPRFEVIAGLGNPGNEYAHTYHNAGVLAVEELAGRPDSWQKARDGSFRFIKRPDTLYVVPETFMNLSGTAIRSALDYFKKDAAHLLIIHDDSDLPLGTWKLEFARGSAGHHGIDSVIEHVGTKDFWRARIGIRPAGKENEKAGEFVLDRITPEDMKTLYGVFEGVKGKLNENETPF